MGNIEKNQSPDVPIRICELCLSPGLGGLELYILNTVQRLSKPGFKCIAVIRPNSQLSKQFKDEKTSFVALDHGLRYFPIISAIKLSRIIDSQGIDILHMHWAKDLAVAVWAKKISQRKPKIIYTRHMEILGKKHDPYHRAMFRQIDKMFTVTRKVRQQAINYLPIEIDKIEVLYLGVKQKTEIDTSCTRLRQRYNIAENDFVVGLVGRVEIEKGQHILIEAISNLMSKGINVHALIVGNAKNPGYVEELKKRSESLGIISQIHFTGFQSNPQEFMKCTDICILTTPHETFGLVLIEAMSMGIPVIGTNFGGVPEIIDDGVNGYLVEPNNAQDLSEKIESLILDKKKCELFSRNAKNTVKNKFDIDNHYNTLEQSFENL